MKIVNKKRFITFIGIFFVILITIGSIINLISYCNSIDENTLTEKELDFISSFEKVEVVISEGDTSWEIQSALIPNTDVREFLYYAGKINNKKMGDIKPGEILVFFKEKK